MQDLSPNWSLFAIFRWRNSQTILGWLHLCAGYGRMNRPWRTPCDPCTARAVLKGKVQVTAVGTAPEGPLVTPDPRAVLRRELSTYSRVGTSVQLWNCRVRLTVISDVYCDVSGRQMPFLKQSTLVLVSLLIKQLSCHETRYNLTVDSTLEESYCYVEILQFSGLMLMLPLKKYKLIVSWLKLSLWWKKCYVMSILYYSLKTKQASGLQSEIHLYYFLTYSNKPQ